MAFDYDNCMAYGAYGSSNQNSNSCEGSFYADFDAKFCRSDGQQRGGYVFDSAEVCVSQVIIVASYVNLNTLKLNSH